VTDKSHAGVNIRPLKEFGYCEMQLSTAVIAGGLYLIERIGL